MISERQIVRFQNKILHWYSKYKRDLPWRRTSEPYKILVSEVMLQQTQVARVIPKYKAWLKQFPTISSLAKASKRDVLQLWSGLGYNRRALYLRDAARVIIEKFNEDFPTDIKSLRTLPGVGEYTARAIVCFAFDEQVALVDTNIRKVILAIFFNSQKSEARISKSEMVRQAHHLNHPEQSRRTNSNEKNSKIQNVSLRQLQKVADRLLPIGDASDWNQALMDYSPAMLRDKKILPRSGILLRKTKQSKFVGSRRYYRGQIIKYLVRHKIVEFARLQTFLNAQGEINLQDILLGMNNEGLIQINEKSITLPS